uniref:Uncharacterized protein n=1 Tax=Arundo donax TaxID=35708 RepID=A0A0A9FR78_ARUDO
MHSSRSWTVVGPIVSRRNVSNLHAVPSLYALSTPIDHLQPCLQLHADNGDKLAISLYGPQCTHARPRNCLINATS